VEIINAFGAVVYSRKSFEKNEYTVDANFAKGIYFVRVNNRGLNAVRKLIVE